jgi:hypothetical protein
LHPEPDQGRVTRKRCAFDSTTPNYLIQIDLTFTLLSVSIRPEAEGLLVRTGYQRQSHYAGKFTGFGAPLWILGRAERAKGVRAQRACTYPNTPRGHPESGRPPRIRISQTPPPPARPQNDPKIPGTRGSPGPGPARPSRRRVSRVPSGRRDANPKPRTRDRARTERPSTECSTVLGPGALMTLGAPCADVARPPASARARARNTNAHPRPSHAMARPRKGALPQTRACDPLSAAPRWASALQP